MVFLRHFESLVVEHLLQDRVESRCPLVHFCLSEVVEVSILDDREWQWVFQVSLSGCCHLQQSVALNILTYETSQHGVAYDGVPELVVHILS